VQIFFEFIRKAVFTSSLCNSKSFMATMAKNIRRVACREAGAYILPKSLPAVCLKPLATKQAYTAQYYHWHHVSLLKPTLKVRENAQTVNQSTNMYHSIIMTQARHPWLQSIAHNQAATSDNDVGSSERAV
jgi:hypothetical protein